MGELAVSSDFLGFDSDLAGTGGGSLLAAAPLAFESAVARGRRLRLLLERGFFGASAFCVSPFSSEPAVLSALSGFAAPASTDSDDFDAFDVLRGFRGDGLLVFDLLSEESCVVPSAVVAAAASEFPADDELRRRRRRRRFGGPSAVASEPLLEFEAAFFSDVGVEAVPAVTSSIDPPTTT